MKKRGKWILFISILLVAAIIFGGCHWFLTWANQPLTKKEAADVPEDVVQWMQEYQEELRNVFWLRHQGYTTQSYGYENWYDKEGVNEFAWAKPVWLRVMVENDITSNDEWFWYGEKVMESKKTKWDEIWDDDIPYETVYHYVFEQSEKVKLVVSVKVMGEEEEHQEIQEHMTEILINETARLQESFENKTGDYHYPYEN